jgi:hypothetical protein
MISAVVAPTKSQVDMTFLSDFFSFFSHTHTLMLERIFLLFSFAAWWRKRRCFRLTERRVKEWEKRQKGEEKTLAAYFQLCVPIIWQLYMIGN